MTQLRADKTTESTSAPQLDIELRDLAERMRKNLDIRDRTYRLKTYEDCFVGEEACRWMIEHEIAADVEQAETIGNLLLESGVFHHVVRDHEFKCDYLFYRFSNDEDHGHRPRIDDAHVSWADLLRSIDPSDSATGLHPRFPEEIEFRSIDELEASDLEPMDDANVELLDRVHPPAWVNPEPKEQYNMVVIGAGTGGLVTAAIVAGLGGEVALIEKNLMGGDCLNFGCVPSKVLLRAAKAVSQLKGAEQYGISIDGEIEVDFDEVMRRVRSVRSHISHHDSAQRFADELGVDVFLGHGRFEDEETIVVDGAELKFTKACIASGAKPAIPPIEGLDDVPYRTNLDLFNLTELPRRLAIIGAGPIGVEMAQAFRRLGSRVTVFDIQDRILAREDEDAAEVVRRKLVEEGVEFRLGAEIQHVEQHGADRDDHHSSLRLELDDEALEFDELLVATGRRPNVDGLALADAEVAFDEQSGIDVDDRLRTTNSDVYAVGDVATCYRFTHAADFMARIAVRNALFFGRQKFEDLLIPWCTYTEPQLAHVGLYPRDLDERGIAYDTYTKPFDDVDRAIVDGETEGFVRIHVDDSATILGATVVGPHAGELISEIAVAMHADVELSKLADVIHPYPTYAGAIRSVGDDLNRRRLTGTVKKLLRGFLALRR